MLCDVLSINTLLICYSRKQILYIKQLWRGVGRRLYRRPIMPLVYWRNSYSMRVILLWKITNMFCYYLLFIYKVVSHTIKIHSRYGKELGCMIYGPHLLIWINSNPSMYKEVHPLQYVGWYYLSAPNNFIGAAAESGNVFYKTWMLFSSTQTDVVTSMEISWRLFKRCFRWFEEWTNVQIDLCCGTKICDLEIELL